MKNKIRNALPLFFAVSSLLGNEPPPDHLLRGLASEIFSERESAQAELTEWSMRHPKAATPALLKLSESDDDPEVRKRALNVLRALGDADYLSDGQGYLGIRMLEELIEVGEDGNERFGIRVVDVMEGSPAQKADLRRGDLIISLDGKGWERGGAVTEFGDTVAAKKPLVDMILMVKRAEPAAIAITVKLGKRPVADLQMAGDDLRLLEEQAKQRHFKDWLRKQQAE